MSTTHAPLYIQIQDFLREGIQAQRFKAGDRLPSETEIARRFATTRATVARALQQLAYEGVISRRAGSGTFVGSGHGLLDSVAMDRLEGQEERLIASGQKITYEVLAWEHAEADEEAATRLGIAVGAPVQRLERLRRADGEAIALERRIVPEAVAALIEREWLERHPIQEVLTRLLGIRIGHIVNVVRAASAGARVARQIECARGEPLLVREHVIHDARGGPILCGETSYRGGFGIKYTQQAGRGR